MWLSLSESRRPESTVSHNASIVEYLSHQLLVCPQIKWSSLRGGQVVQTGTEDELVREPTDGRWLGVVKGPKRVSPGSDHTHLVEEWWF